MTLLLTMLPIYLFGNFHCIGMCGPLVMMISQHKYRYFYFLGRLMSFTMAGALAGGLGAVIHVFLSAYKIGALTSFIFGFLLLLISLFTLFGWHYPGYHFLSRRLAAANHTLSLLMLRDQAWPAFLFGFFTLALPCGQTLIVFSACALAGSVWVGLLNGCVFALLTTPSLFIAMHAHRLLNPLKRHYNKIVGIFGIVVAVLAICRGLAEINLIPHLILNPQANHHYHLVIF